MTTDNDEIPVISDIADIYEDTVAATKRYDNLKSEFRKQFNNTSPDFFVRAPGRVNLIGEHIDYEGYSVLPMAIAKEVIMAVRINDDTTTTTTTLSNVNHEKFPTRTVSTNPLDEITGKHDWSHYFLCGYKGAFLLTGNNDTNNNTGISMSILVDGNVPLASGLSSSSAFVVASTITTLTARRRRQEQHMSSSVIPYTLTPVAELSRKAEGFIGTMGGGMDQAISCLGKKGIARLIHFVPTLSSEAVTLPSAFTFVIADSLTTSEKALSATECYNKRVVECMLAAKLIAKSLLSSDISNNIETLQQVQQHSRFSLCEMIEKAKEVLPEKTTLTLEELQQLFNVPDLQDLFRDNDKIDLIKDVLLNSKSGYKLRDRALHVYAEAKRVFDFKNLCCEKNDDENAVGIELGKLMNASQESCDTLYECSSDKLNALTSTCVKLGALGSRLTGAGWGGSTVSLVREGDVEDFMKNLRKEFYHEEGDFVFACKPSIGACVVTN